MVTFQLIADDTLGADIDLASIAPKIAEILDVDIGLIDTLFNSDKSTLYQSEAFKIVRDKKVALAKLGIRCEIKPIKRLSVSKSNIWVPTVPEEPEPQKDTQDDIELDSALSLLKTDCYPVVDAVKDEGLDTETSDLELLKTNSHPVVETDEEEASDFKTGDLELAKTDSHSIVDFDDKPIEVEGW